MAVVFHRLLMPDGYSVDLDQFQGLDQIGEEGLKDKVNNHYLQIFGTSIALGVIAGASQITQGGGTITTSGSQAFTNGAAGSVSQSATTILDRFIQIPPKRFYDPKNGDVILNPLDKRCPYWGPSEELRRRSEAKALAVSLFQPPQDKKGEFFIESPQKIFAFLMAYGPTPKELVKWMSDPQEIDRRLKGTEHAHLIDPRAHQQRAGVLGSLGLVADSLRLLPKKDDANGEWSATEWAETRQGWIFITSLPAEREALRPLQSLWIDLLVLRLLNEPKEGQKRAWFVIDELASLQKLPQLHTAITENRKSNNPVILGFQGKAQLEVLYGHLAEVMLSQAGMRTARLDEIVRQKDAALKSAVELLATGQVSAALDALQQQGSVKEIPNAEERVRAIAKSYVESPQNTLIVSPDNASRRELNVAVRRELRVNGALAPEDHAFRVLVQRQDMTGAERSWASHYDINDVVRYTRGSKSIGIEAAAYASVVAINPAANQLTVEKENGELATYDPRRLTGVSVYQEIQREFSVGDRIQFTAPDKSLGVANRDMAAIEAIHPDSRLSVRLDNNRQIEFDPSEHRHLDHGYAVTSHSSQGLTAERVLVHGDTSVHPDLLNSRFAYVSVSRASLDAKIYTNDTAELGQRLSGEVSKSSAIEFSHSTANAMADLSLGQGI
jgi:hypothetical protein